VVLKDVNTLIMLNKNFIKNKSEIFLDKNLAVAG